MGNGTEKRTFLAYNCLIWNGNKNTTDIYKFSSLCLLVAAQYQQYFQQTRIEGRTVCALSICTERNW